MTWRRHGGRIGLLIVLAATLFVWLNRHSEVTFADGLRYIRQAERIDRGEWSEGLLRAVDHPLHSLAIAAAHRTWGGEGPASWQRAAQVASILAGVLLVVPLYLLGWELYDDTTAWVGCALFLANAMMGYVVVNVLSETTFLLVWTWGLWCAVRFLREGHPGWLPPVLAFGALAYLARPEGLLLPLALLATLLIIPWSWATRIGWPRWWAAVGLLTVGPLLLVGPYMAVKGGLGTKPSIARLIGTAPESPAAALERERPLPPGQSAFTTYRLAVGRTIKVFRGAVTVPLVPFAVVGLMLTWTGASRLRAWVFLAVIVAASAAALVRLHATGGYCTVRHALVPGMLLTVAAAYGLTWLLRSVVFDGRWIGKPGDDYRVGPVFWALALVALTGAPFSWLRAPARGSFDAYRGAGEWIARHAVVGKAKVLDMTDWSLYFSGRKGYALSDIHEASADPETRWVVVRQAHVRGRFPYNAVLIPMLDGLEPVARFPEHAHGQLQIRVYDRQARPAAVFVGRTAPVSR